MAALIDLTKGMRMNCDNCMNMQGGGADLKKAPSKRKRPLPLVGPITYYLPIRNGRPCMDGMTGELRLIAQAELSVVRGEFEGMNRFYAAIRKDGRNFLTAAGVALFAAVGTDDPRLFDTVLKDIAAYPSRYGTPEAKLAVEIVMTWLRNFLRVSTTYPSWLEHFDLSIFPGEWRHQVAYLVVERLERKGDYQSAEILAEVLLGLESEKMVKSSAADIYLKVAKAIVCRDDGRMAEAARWCRAAVESAKLQGIVLPFLGVMMGPKSVMERVLMEDAPELLTKIKQLTNGFFRNLVKFHNRYTGDSVTEELRPREFYIAGLIKRGARYKEIAERTGMSEGRVRNTVSDIYDILHIKRGAEIGNLVW